jgi:hypothetical protein
MMKINNGDVLTLKGTPEAGYTHLAIVTRITDGQIWVVPLTNETELAGDLDIYVGTNMSGLRYETAVLTHLEIVITEQQIIAVRHLLDKRIHEEILLCQMGEPSESTSHGLELLADDRDPRLGALREFDTTWFRFFSEDGWIFFEMMKPVVSLGNNFHPGLGDELLKKDQVSSATARNQLDLLQKLAMMPNHKKMQLVGSVTK